MISITNMGTSTLYLGKNRSYGKLVGVGIVVPPGDTRFFEGRRFLAINPSGARTKVKVKQV